MVTKYKQPYRVYVFVKGINSLYRKEYVFNEDSHFFIKNLKYGKYVIESKVYTPLTNDTEEINKIIFEINENSPQVQLFNNRIVMKINKPYESGKGHDVLSYYKPLSISEMKLNKGLLLQEYPDLSYWEWDVEEYQDQEIKITKDDGNKNLKIKKILTPLNNKKTALLIANNDYEFFSPLVNPVQEALLLEESLIKLGFNVTIIEDASKSDMLDSLYDFELKVKENGGIAFFHYGGHAVQVDGRNYLIPVDANIPDVRRVKTRAVDVEEIMSSLEASGSDTNIVVLDSCRNNPFPASDRSATRGLAVVGRKPKNSIIVYSAESGTTAKDGVFTPTLTELLSTPDTSFQEILIKVRKSVYEQTNGEQIPGAYDQTFESIYLQ